MGSASTMGNITTAASAATMGNASRRAILDFAHYLTLDTNNDGYLCYRLPVLRIVSIVHLQHCSS
jgi:hypothetical protein